MREILFRGKRVDNGEWIKGFYAENGHGSSNIQPKGKFLANLVKPETVGQFTNMTDCINNLLFEGDILESDSERFVVDWDDEFSGFYLTNVNPRYQGVAMFANVADDGYIIGNVHDNPEMLNNETLAEFQPVIHAKWVRVRKYRDEDGYINEIFRCSNCEIPRDEEFSYCPSCGAKMDGD